MIVNGEHIPMKHNKNELRVFLNKHDLLDELREKYGDTTIRDDKILNDIKQDYEDLIFLRNRLKEGTDKETEIYEEDHITLDHILDYMEILMVLIGMGEIK